MELSKCYMTIFGVWAILFRVTELNLSFILAFSLACFKIVLTLLEALIFGRVNYYVSPPHFRG